MIYLDNAATSWPKPPEVVLAMADFLERTGGNPGRSGHRLSIAAGRTVYEAREAVAELFNAPDPLRVIFTANATQAILCRVGLHCAPAAHRTIGTFPEGTVRLAPGIYTTLEDVHVTLRAIEKLVKA